MLDVDDVWSMSASPCAIVVDEQGVLPRSMRRRGCFYQLLLLVLVLLTTRLDILFVTLLLTISIDAHRPIFSLTDIIIIIIMLITGSILCFDGLVDRTDDELS
jgi:hypothetical protein